jgi:outer membrane receptor for ferric coprogen and ferric-rhodotorulic acid
MVRRKIQRCAVVCCAAGYVFAGIDVARGEQTLASFTFNIDRQPLDGALQQLARQGDLQVVYFSRVTEGVAAPAIRGQYTLDAALHQLLAGSRLTFRVVDAKTVEVRPAQSRPQQREPAEEPTERKHQDSAALEEVVVVGLAEQVIATRIATPLREIPQTVSLVSREQSRQQNSIDLGDVLSHVAGITTTRVGSLHEEYSSRGYLITSLHVDGGAALDPTFSGVAPMTLIQAELSEFDHVEVLRGSDALFTGGGNPGGTLSLVRKLPQRVFALETNASAGSWDKQRYEIDVTGPIAGDGALRARANAVYSSNDFYYDYASAEHTKLFAALAWDITPNATLIGGGSYQSDDAVPSETGLPRNADGSDARLPRDTAFVFDWQKQRARTTETYLQYRQAFAGDWNVKLNAANWSSRAEVANGLFGGFINPVTQGLNPPQLVFTESPIDLDQSTADATLTGVLDWFGARQELAVGGDFTRTHSRLSEVEYDPLVPLADVRSFDPAAYPDPRRGGAPDFEIRGVTRREQYGVFASMRLYFDDAWSVVAGARVAGFTIDTEYSASFSGIDISGTTHSAGSGILTPYGGLMYNVNDHYTLYASYADIYGNSSNVLRPDGSPVDVKHGVTLEAGIKSQWRNGALNGSLAVYRITQSNSQLIAADQIPGMEYDGICCLVGKPSRSHGVDLDFSGEVLEGWRIGLGYSYNENERYDGTPFSPITPKHLVKAWTSSRLSGDLRRWSVGGDLRAQSGIRFSLTRDEGGVPGLTPEGEQGAYAVLDLRAGFEIDPNWQISLSVNNATDEIYYESIGFAPFDNWYGEPRNVALRIDGRY